ncbi:hypothetical protein FRC20_005420 [Serendipita sp. 405]|nr:hypothetical protein FRC20_005420 [Serendipita sp. 405]
MTQFPQLENIDLQKPSSPLARNLISRWIPAYDIPKLHELDGSWKMYQARTTHDLDGPDVSIPHLTISEREDGFQQTDEYRTKWYRNESVSVPRVPS